MAGPTFITHDTTSVGTATTLTVTKPAAVQDGDYLLVHLQHVTGSLVADPTAPSGWSLVSPGRQANSSTTGWFYEKIAASEPASWDWTNFPSGAIFGGIQVWRGVDQTTPRHQTHILQNTNIAGTSVALTVTNTIADCGLAAFVGQDQTAAAATFTQASMTELYDADFTASILHCGAYREAATTATTYARTVSYTAERCCGALFALAPDPVVSPSGIPSAEAWGSPNASLVLTASPSSIASAEAWGLPSVSLAGGGTTVNPTGIASAEAWGAAAVALSLLVSPSGIPSAETWGTPSATPTLIASPTGIPSSQAFGVPVIALSLAVSPLGIPSAGAFGTPGAGLSLVVGPVGIATAEIWGTPAVSLAVPVEPRDLALVGGLEPVRFLGTIQVGRFVGSIESNRFISLN